MMMRTFYENENNATGFPARILFQNGLVPSRYDTIPLSIVQSALIGMISVLC
jgi:hypothetical protein